MVRKNNREAYNSNDSRLAGIIAVQSAQLIENALLLEELSEKVELLKVSKKKLKEENIEYRYNHADNFKPVHIVGKSPAMKNILTDVSKYAKGDRPILITGETGTGKELIARAIHNNSDRRNGPFIPVNCGSYTEALIESVFFGYVKGSHNEAKSDEEGLFHAADKGTIFLDEIGNAPSAIQITLLRAIEDNEIRRLGSKKTERVDVHVISATNTNIEDAIAAKDFRDDFYYRISMFKIELPPLRERKNDIPLLIDFFLEKLKIKLQKDSLSISSKAMDILMNYSWPGNIRELESTIERAAYDCDDTEIDVYDLSSKIIAPDIDPSKIKSYKGHLDDIVRDVEINVIRSALIKF